MNKPKQMVALDKAADCANLTCQFMDQVILPRVKDLASSSDRNATIVGLYFRATCWMRTLGKLDHVTDFQAADAAARSLLELATNLSLLVLSGDPQDAHRLMAWEDSYRLSLAEAYLSYVDSLPSPDQALMSRVNVQAFVDREGAGIRANRKKYWGGKHPKHWMGKDLEQATACADKINPEPSLRYLSRTYQEHVRRMNVMLHGASLALVRNMEASTFASVMAMAYLTSARVALVIVAVVMTGVGQDMPMEDWRRVQELCAEALRSADSSGDGS
ncbi:MAG: hypothetical protein L6R43_07255 [Planctomycetes bacterium]|nr:hypothetical protein [Planctomycetota bacterium]MCK6531059.1 hypothetical protein [Myxococcota bacterium]